MAGRIFEVSQGGVSQGGLARGLARTVSGVLRPDVSQRYFFGGLASGGLARGSRKGYRSQLCTYALGASPNSAWHSIKWIQAGDEILSKMVYEHQESNDFSGVGLERRW